MRIPNYAYPEQIEDDPEEIPEIRKPWLEIQKIRKKEIIREMEENGIHPTVDQCPDHQFFCMVQSAFESISIYTYVNQDEFESTNY
jgi:hypothetical protein